MIAKKIGPILREIEDDIWNFELYKGVKPDFEIEDLRAATKIFMTLILDNMWNLQESENISLEDRGKMAQKAGEELRKFIKTFVNIDSHDFYKSKNK